METRAHHILIGSFTLAGGLAILLFTLWLTHYGSDEQMRSYDVLFNETVSGLSVGSPVQYSGIRVGEVRNLNLDPEDPRQVWARISVSGTAPIREDTEASLTLLNVTGAAAISLSEGSPDSPPLQARDQEVPVIVAEPSPLTRLRVNSDELLLRITTLLDNANRILSADNAERLVRILDNLDTLSSSLAEQQETLREGLENLTQSGQQFNVLMTNLNRQLDERAVPMLDSANRAAEQVEQLSRRLEQVLADNAPLVSSGLEDLQEIAPAIRDLRQLLNSMRSLSEGLENNPDRLLFGNEPIREFRP